MNTDRYGTILGNAALFICLVAPFVWAVTGTYLAAMAVYAIGIIAAIIGLAHTPDDDPALIRSLLIEVLFVHESEGVPWGDALDRVFIPNGRPVKGALAALRLVERASEEYPHASPDVWVATAINYTYRKEY